MLVLGDIRVRKQKGLEELEAPLGDVLGADIEDVLVSNPSTAIVRQNELFREQFGTGPDWMTPNDPQWVEPASKQLSQQEALDRIGAADLDGQLEVPSVGIPEAALDILIRRKKAELERLSVQRRAPGGVGTALLRLGVGVGASLLDPVNVGSAFLPVVTGAKYAEWLAARSSRLGRFGVRAGVGSVEGAAGAALVEPLVLAGRLSDQAEYGLYDSFLNVVFGTVMGGGLHSVGGLAGELMAPRPGSVGSMVTDLPQPAKETILAQAVGARIEGVPVRVDATLDAMAKESPAVRRVVEKAKAEAAEVRAPVADDAALDDARIAYWYQEVKRLRSAGTEPPPGESLFSFVRQRGGIRPDDLEGAEARAAVQDARLPPGFFSRKGRNADEIAEAAWEAGYIGEKGGERPAVRELYDALSREARGERVFPAERLAEFDGNARQLDEMDRELQEIGVRIDDDALKVARALARREQSALAEAEAGPQQAPEAWAREWDDPEWVEASVEAEQIAGATDYRTKSLEAAQKEAELAEEELQALLEAGALDAEDAAMMKAADEALALAKAEAAAAKEGALCMARNA